MDNSLRSDKSMLPHNASPHSPRSSIPLRHGKASGSFGLVVVAGAKEPAFSLPIPALDLSAAPPFLPSVCHPLYSTLRPRSQTLLHAGVWAAYFAALCAAACRPERERVWIRGRKVPANCAATGRGRIFFYIHSMKRGSADRCSSFQRWSY